MLSYGFVRGVELWAAPASPAKLWGRSARPRPGARSNTTGIGPTRASRRGSRALSRPVQSYELTKRYPLNRRDHARTRPLVCVCIRRTHLGAGERSTPLPPRTAGRHSLTGTWIDRVVTALPAETGRKGAKEQVLFRQHIGRERRVVTSVSLIIDQRGGRDRLLARRGSQNGRFHPERIRTCLLRAGGEDRRGFVGSARRGHLPVTR